MRKTWVQSQVESYYRLQNGTRCLLINTWCYKVLIKSRVDQIREKVWSSPSPWCKSYWKGSHWGTFDHIHQLYLLTYTHTHAHTHTHIYIYIYIYIHACVCVCVCVRACEVCVCVCLCVCERGMKISLKDGKSSTSIFSGYILSFINRRTIIFQLIFIISSDPPKSTISPFTVASMKIRTMFKKCLNVK